MAVCALWTHSIGGEVRLTVDAEWCRDEAVADKIALLDLALDWKQQFEARGWSAMDDSLPRCVSEAD